MLGDAPGHKGFWRLFCGEASSSHARKSQLATCVQRAGHRLAEGGPALLFASSLPRGGKPPSRLQCCAPTGMPVKETAQADIAACARNGKHDQARPNDQARLSPTGKRKQLLGETCRSAACRRLGAGPHSQRRQPADRSPAGSVNIRLPEQRELQRLLRGDCEEGSPPPHIRPHSSSTQQFKDTARLGAGVGAQKQPLPEATDPHEDGQAAAAAAEEVASGVKVGGRWSTEAADFLRLLAARRPRGSAACASVGLRPSLVRPAQRRPLLPFQLDLRAFSWPEQP